MARRLATISTVVAIALTGVGVSAEAATTTYDLVNNGQSQFVITATITNASQGLNNAQIMMNGSADAVLSITSGTETIDSSAPALDSFDFTSQGTGSTSATGTYVLTAGGKSLGTLVLSNLTLASTAPAALTGSGTTSNPYAFSTTSATDSASYTFNGASPTSQNFPGQSFAGTIVTASNGSVSFEQTSGIELGSFTSGGSTVALWLDNNSGGSNGVVKNDVTFDGQATVPLPAGVWLLLSGLGGLGLMHRRSVSAVKG